MGVLQCFDVFAWILLQILTCVAVLGSSLKVIKSICIMNLSPPTVSKLHCSYARFIYTLIMNIVLLCSLGLVGELVGTLATLERHLGWVLLNIIQPISLNWYFLFKNLITLLFDFQRVGVVRTGIIEKSWRKSAAMCTRFNFISRLHLLILYFILYVFMCVWLHASVLVFRRYHIQGHLVSFIAGLICWWLLMSIHLVTQVILLFINISFIDIFHCPHCLLLAWIFIIGLVAVFLVSHLQRLALSDFLESTYFVVHLMLRRLEGVVWWLCISVAELRSLFVFRDHLPSVPHLSVDRYIWLGLMRVLSTSMLILLDSVMVNAALSVVYPWISFMFWVSDPVDQRLWYWWYVKAVGAICKLSLEIEINGTFHIYSIFNLIIVCMYWAILCINWNLIIL